MTMSRTELRDIDDKLSILTVWGSRRVSDNHKVDTVTRLELGILYGKATCQLCEVQKWNQSVGA